MEEIKPANRTKPAYLVVVNDPTVTGKIAYYKADTVDRNATHVVIKGHKVSKTDADKLEENIEAQMAEGKKINVEFPWQNIVRINNLSYKQKA